jgi:hypothetical protein
MAGCTLWGGLLRSRSRLRGRVSSARPAVPGRRLVALDLVARAVVPVDLHDRHDGNVVQLLRVSDSLAGRRPHTAARAAAAQSPPPSRWGSQCSGCPTACGRVKLSGACTCKGQRQVAPGAGLRCFHVAFRHHDGVFPAGSASKLLLVSMPWALNCNVAIVFLRSWVTQRSLFHCFRVRAAWIAPWRRQRPAMTEAVQAGARTDSLQGIPAGRPSAARALRWSLRGCAWR